MPINTPLRASVLLVAALASACANNPTTPASADASPQPPQVTYSLYYADGSRMKQEPREVMVVRRSTTGKAVATQVLLNVALFALAGGLAVNPFSKDGLKGERIDDVQDRERVRNPISTDFIAALQARVNAAVASRPGLASRQFKHPIVVAGGHTTLVYETLSGDEQERFQLKTDLQVFKRRESAGLFSMNPATQVSCADTSAPARPMAEWSAQDYALVRQTLDPMLENCSQRVLAQLEEMLRG